MNYRRAPRDRQGVSVSPHSAHAARGRWWRWPARRSRPTRSSCAGRRLHAGASLGRPASRTPLPPSCERQHVDDHQIRDICRELLRASGPSIEPRPIACLPKPIVHGRRPCHLLPHTDIRRCARTESFAARFRHVSPARRAARPVTEASSSSVTPTPGTPPTRQP
jgi:hypothetical protein